MPTISDVARRAGVSPVTVSRVINSAAHVNAATCAAARAALNDLDAAGGLLAADEFLGPAAPVDGRVNEFSARIEFGESHVDPIKNNGLRRQWASRPRVASQQGCVALCEWRRRCLRCLPVVGR